MARIILLLATLASVQSLTPLDPKLLTTLPRIGSPVPSPDRHLALLPVYVYNSTSNLATSNINLLSLRSNSLRDVTAPDTNHKDLDPFWLDHDTVGWIREQSDSINHVWIKKARETEGKPKKLTNFPVSISNVQYVHTPDRNLLFFSAEVYPGLNLTETSLRDKQKSKRFDTAMAFDKLFIRHWDEFLGSKKRQIFAVEVEQNETSKEFKVVKNSEVNIMNGTQLESPIRPFSVTEDYSVSKDGSLVAFVAKRPGVDEAWSVEQNIYLVGVHFHKDSLSTLAAEKPHKPISLTDDTKGACSHPIFSPSGENLAWLQMHRPQYEADRRQIIIYNIMTKKKLRVAFFWDRSPTDILWSPCGTKLYVTAEEHGRNKIFKIDLEPGRGHRHHTVTALEENGSSAHLSWGREEAEDLILYVKSDMTKPNEVYTVRTDGTDRIRRTFTSQHTLSNVFMSKPEEFWFNGAKRENVMGWMLKPFGYDEKDKNKKYPVAFLIHGGPESSWLDSFSTRWNPNIYASAGFATVMINFHGSTGYGQEFTDSIRLNWGNYPYVDLMKGLDFALGRYSFMDGNRVAGLGASYGGYMINWINGHTHRFKCLVNHDGIHSTVATYYSTEELYFPEHEFGGTPWTNHQMYDQWNPERYVGNWKTPTLIIHGGKDYRLVDGEGFSAFTALQRQKIPSRLLYFPDENHWVLKPANSLRWHDEVLKWITKWTKENRENKTEAEDKTEADDKAEDEDKAKVEDKTEVEVKNTPKLEFQISRQTFKFQ